MIDFTNIDRVPSPPARPAASHKGTFGTVMVVGGSATMLGAPAICARAAFRAGAGLVKIASPRGVVGHALVIEPGATGVELSGDLERDIEALDEADAKREAVLAVGPGMGTLEDAGRLVLRLVRGRRSVVLDADGLNLLAQSGERLSDRGAGESESGELVLTPHPGEFRRLAKPLGIEADGTDADERPAAAAALARAHGAVAVLKGQRTIVTDGRRLYTNDTGNPALATAGSGDVLTGVIASLMAQGMTGFDAAVLGVRAHGRAADLWAREHGERGLLSRELADHLPAALRERAG